MPKRIGSIEGILQTDVYLDRATDQIGINRVQDVEPILKQNRAERNAFDGHYGDWCKVAEIPFIVIEQLMKDGLWDSFESGDEAVIHRWLKDPNNRAFLTAHQGF